MADPRQPLYSFDRFLELPLELINMIFEQWTLQEKSRLSQTHRSIHTLFQPFVKAHQCLLLIMEADYDAVEKIIADDPLIMFSHVKLSNTETITPLKLAFKLYDTYMWKIFWEAIKDTPKYVAQFFEQKKAQQEHITLEPLFTKYNWYLGQDQHWKDQEMTNEEHDDAWRQLGKEQGNCLSKVKHMLKVFCSSKSWALKLETNLPFNAHTTPRPRSFTVYNYDNQQFIDLSKPSFLAQLGSLYTLLRGPGGESSLEGGHCSGPQSTFLWRGCGGCSLVEHDLTMWRCLFKARQSEFDHFTLENQLNWQATIDQQQFAYYRFL
ncbi:MAG TPA: hypothetical protein VJN02_09035 [Gammaproteobacteria bacterium]|nr:hypothetical protein [Gammaproteobacteria bacterium]